MAATDRDVESELQLMGTLAGRKATTCRDVWGRGGSQDVLIAAGSPFKRAIRTEVIDALVGAGASLSARDEDGDTPPHLAAVYGKTLVPHGSPGCCNPLTSATTLHRAAPPLVATGGRFSGGAARDPESATVPENTAASGKKQLA